MRERKIRQTAKDAPEFHSGVAWLGLQDHHLDRGAGQGRRLHDRVKERRVGADTVVVKPL